MVIVVTATFRPDIPVFVVVELKSVMFDPNASFTHASMLAAP
jgi:hypothetical protein